MFWLAFLISYLLVILLGISILLLFPVARAIMQKPYYGANLKARASRALGSFFYDLHLLVPCWQWLIDLCVWVSLIFNNRVPLVFLLLMEDSLSSLHPPVTMIYKRGFGDKLVEKYPDLLRTWNEIGNRSPAIPDPEELTREFIF